MAPDMQQPPPPTPRGGSIPRLLIGAFLVLMGLLVALNQLGWVESDHLLRFWPVIVVLYGLAILQCRRRIVPGSIVVLIGAWLLLNTLHLLTLEPWQFLWPLILVVVGARILMRGGAPRQPPAPPTSIGSDASSASAAPLSGSPPVSHHISMFGMMGASKQRVSGLIFRSADMTLFMGGCELDLRDALLGADGTAYVEVFSLMGGAHIIVPPSWKIVMQVTPIMGGVEDKSRPVMGGAQFLYVRGTVLMGGVEISN
jgi:predicted membrane protein